jgi:hypothetical protein
MGVHIHRKTLCDWALLASDWLSIIYREIQYEHWRALYRQIDETPIHYLQPGSGKAQTGYLWTSNIPDGTVFYHWHDGRDAKGMTGLFEKPEAAEADEPIDPKLVPLLRIIQCDGHIVYPSWAKDKAWIKLMGCHSHVRRKFFEATEQSPRLVAWILRQIAHLYHIEKRLRETKAGPALREAVRAAESRMIHQRLRKAIDKLALRRSILPKSKLGKAISYAINQWPNLETYLADGRVEILQQPRRKRDPPDQVGSQKLAVPRQRGVWSEVCHPLHHRGELPAPGYQSQGIPHRRAHPPARHGGQRGRHADPSQLAQSPQQQAGAYGGVTS